MFNEEKCEVCGGTNQVRNDWCIECRAELDVWPLPRKVIVSHDGDDYEEVTDA